jgi:membrane-associated phospholipid phosphatase
VVGWLAGLAAAVVVALSVLLHDARSTRFDNWVVRELFAQVGDRWRDALLGLATPGMSIVLLAVLALIAGLARQWRFVALAVAGPLVAVGLTEYVLKPIVNRTLTVRFGTDVQLTGLEFPSGHETTLAAMLTVYGVVLLHVRLRAVARAGWLALLMLWALAGATGLTRAVYHYATDTLGGIAVAVAVVLGVALGIDALAARLTSRPDVAPRSRATAAR